MQVNKVLVEYALQNFPIFETTYCTLWLYFELWNSTLCTLTFFLTHIDDKSTFICGKCNAKIHGIVKHIILFTLQAISFKLQSLIVI